MSGEAQTSGRAALDGIRVLDLATPLGEATGRVFADLGAEVIKVEPPSGCESRFAPPFAKGGEGDPEGSLFWRVWGLGKKSVVLDLRDARSQSRLRALAEQADVAVVPGPPERAKRTDRRRRGTTCPGEIVKSLSSAMIVFLRFRSAFRASAV